MPRKTYYDYLNEGLQDLYDYLNGDHSKGRQSTVQHFEPSMESLKLHVRESRYDRYDPNVEAQFMEPGNLYDDMPETEYDTDDTFEFYVSYCMNNCGNEGIAREYLESENLPESFIDSIIDEVYARFDMQ